MDGLDIFGTPEEQLIVVNQAIYTILKGGQSYKLGSRQLTRADLGLLCNMQSKLQAAVADSQETPLFSDTVVAVFDGR